MKSKAKYAAFMGIALALTAVLSFADSCISAAFPIPGIRLGLANIAIIAVMIRYGTVSGLLMTLLRSGFVFLTRGASAAVMSLSGGLLAFAADNNETLLQVFLHNRSHVPHSGAAGSCLRAYGKRLYSCLCRCANACFHIYRLPYRNGASGSARVS